MSTHNTLQSLYNTVRYNTDLDITRFKDGSQKYIDYTDITRFKDGSQKCIDYIEK